MLDAVEAFFFNGGDELAVAEKGCGGVAVEGVNTEEEQEVKG
jgi:hypothetical protein